MVKITTPQEKEQYISEWVSQVWSYAKGLDPDNERDWADIAFGFFLAKGCAFDDALKLEAELLKRSLL